MQLQPAPLRVSGPALNLAGFALWNDTVVRHRRRVRGQAQGGRDAGHTWRVLIADEGRLGVRWAAMGGGELRRAYAGSAGNRHGGVWPTMMRRWGAGGVIAVAYTTGGEGDRGEKKEHKE